MAVTQDDLARLGIADPNTGAPLADPLAEAPLLGVDAFPTASEEAAKAAEARITSGAGAWDSDENPYKKEAEQLKKQVGKQPSVVDQLTAYEHQLNQQAAQAWDTLVSKGMPAEIATELLMARRDAAFKEAELQAHRSAALPMVRNGIAAEIAAEYSDKRAGIVINPDELQGETTVEAMKARAKTLKESRRDARYDTRQLQAVDRAEGAPPQRGAVRAPAEMSPSTRIAYGLSRGHL